MTAHCNLEPEQVRHEGKHRAEAQEKTRKLHTVMMSTAFIILSVSDQARRAVTALTISPESSLLVINMGSRNS